MGGAMQLYAGFTLLAIVILILIGIVALAAFLQRVGRRVLARWRGGGSPPPSERRSDWR